MNRASISLLLLIIVVEYPQQAGGGYIIALGDTTPTFHVPGAPISAIENGRFFSSILGQGNRVAFATGARGRDLREYYAGLPGVSSIIVERPVADNLGSFDLLVVHTPEEGFDESEAESIAEFVRRGGSLLVVAEGEANFGPWLLHVDLSNQLLAAIGSEMWITGSQIDRGLRSLSASQIVTHSLTQGTSGLLYGFAHRISGGMPLLLRTDGHPFASLEMVAVPEPQLWLPGVGCIGMWACVRKRPLPLVSKKQPLPVPPLPRQPPMRPSGPR